MANTKQTPWIVLDRTSAIAGVGSVDGKVGEVSLDSTDAIKMGAVLSVNGNIPDENGNVSMSSSEDYDVLYLGEILHVQSSGNPAGTLAADGGQYLRSTYPDVWDAIKSGDLYAVADDAWQAGEFDAFSYGTSDGTDTGTPSTIDTGDYFRVPDVTNRIQNVQFSKLVADDLNNLTADDTGDYYQNIAADATKALHYPVEGLCGTLVVYGNGVGPSNGTAQGATQIYYAADSDDVYTRFYTAATDSTGGMWSNWVSSDEFANISLVHNATTAGSVINWYDDSTGSAIQQTYLGRSGANATTSTFYNNLGGNGLSLNDSGSVTLSAKSGQPVTINTLDVTKDLTVSSGMTSIGNITIGKSSVLKGTNPDGTTFNMLYANGTSGDVCLFAGANGKIDIDGDTSVSGTVTADYLDSTHDINATANIVAGGKVTCGFVDIIRTGTDGSALGIDSVGRESCYILHRDTATGSTTADNMWFIGRGAPQGSDVSLYSYTGSNSVVLQDDGDITVKSQSGKTALIDSGTCTISGLAQLGKNHEASNTTLNPTSEATDYNRFFVQGDSSTSNKFGFWGTGVHMTYGLAESSSMMDSADIFISQGSSYSPVMHVAWNRMPVDGTAATPVIKQVAFTDTVEEAVAANEAKWVARMESLEARLALLEGTSIPVE